MSGLESVEIKFAYSLIRLFIIRFKLCEVDQLQREKLNQI